MPLASTLEELLAGDAPQVLLECVAGSHAYGLNREGSDVDRRGIFALPASAYLSIDEAPEQIGDRKGDVTFYSLRRFATLAASCNPNMLEILFAPEECVLRSHPAARLLRERRELFLSRECYGSHVRYAESQIHKARGQNKWVNREQPELPPRIEDFCWIVPKGTWNADPPLRPVRLADSGVSLAECHAAALEHAPGVYRLYHYGSAARGVFRGGLLVAESIPLADESARFLGLLIHNRQGFEAALRDHHNYWTWRRNRNEERWESQESGHLDYDAKNLMHTLRLLLSAESLLRTGTLRVRFDGADRDYLLAVRAGRFRYEELLADAKRRIEELAMLLPNSPLPETADRAAISATIEEVTAEWERERHA